MAMDAGELTVAEAALAACELVDRLQYVLHVKSIPSREGRAAELLVLKRQPQQAEAVLLQVWQRTSQQPHTGMRAVQEACLPQEPL